jgi:signal transduction histidine kinase
MNQHLQTILNFIQQANHLSAEEKTSLAKAINNAESELNLSDFQLEKMIGELEQKSKTVEAQNRELEIESSLERVRIVALGMRKPEDFPEICEVLFAELKNLGFAELRNAMINIYNDGKSSFLNYDYATNSGKTVTVMPYDFHPLIKKQVDITKKANDAFYEFSFTGKELKDFRELRKNNGEPDDPKLDDTSSLHYYFYSIGTGSIGISAYRPITAEKLVLLKRFRNVFDFAYRRYLDLAQAEAQAKEAKIEAALERVRSRSMAMHKSEELADLSLELVKQVQTLGVATWFCAFNIYDEDGKGSMEWGSNGEGTFPKYRTPREGIFLRYYEAGKRGETLLINEIDEEECPTHYDFLCSLPGVGDQLLKMKEAGLPFPTSQIDHVAFFKYGYIIFITYDPTPESHDIFKRFAKVFEQTYTRFLDLKKAEAQAREATIENALEKVRSRTMAMQKSTELQDASLLLFQQVQALGIPPFACGFNIWDDDKKAVTAWMGSVQGLQPPFKTSSAKDIYQLIYGAAQRGESLFVKEQAGKELEIHYQYLASIPVFRDIIMVNWSKAGVSYPTFQIIHCAFFSQGYLMFITYEPVTEAYDIFKRFAKVFEQTYTRFLDLQKAEAQAREATIENALEKVRSRTMAMQNSDELPDAANVLFLEVQKLGIPAWSCGYNVLAEDKKSAICWMSSEGALQEPFKLRLFGETSFDEMGDFLRSEKTMLVQELGDKAIDDHYGYMKSFPDLKPTFDNIEAKGLSLPTYQINHLCKFTYGFLLFITYEQVPGAYDIFKRFTKVFEQTYTRFLDLQKAEAQAREAQIEAALERVRSRSLAMHKSEELEEVILVVSEQLQQLKFRFNNVSFGLNNEQMGLNFWLASPGQPKPFLLKVPYLDNPAFNLPLQARINGTDFSIDILTQRENRQFLQHLFDYSVLGNISDESKDFLLGKKGFARSQVLMKNTILTIGNYTPVPYTEEQNAILKRFGNVFEQAYTRFLDLQKAEAQTVQAELDLIKLQTEKKRAEDALTELKAAQSQLIQSEKMASLGELTAGIAHEIQNPLNFINNFSEVSNELIDEMNDEIDKGDLAEAKAIAADIKQNLEKIHHHGKRADGIVKGMLQHSRSSSGIKEPTDINKLADEYLRLAYHGLRAKDKSFNASMKTDYDESIGNINIIPQDMGRVILNLITNAFYVVDEKKKQIGEDYEPTVYVSTKKVDETVEVSVKDNGNGIPQKVLDKIFQPFFTTKPTGQGTGLGLSLSYDIVKAHGGELLVETKEGEGSNFSIQLPTTN